ncbi:MAG: 4-hydroxy-3-methylbut-2-enyl diphosphate reductase [Pseudonocardiaceae bacterium]
MSVTANSPGPGRTILLASPRSFCTGVERAIAIVERLLEQRGDPIYVRKQIVHNTHVVADLQACGAVFVEELDDVPDGATVVFSAHGVSPAVRADAAGRGLEVIDGTCPLVTKVHAEASRFAARGDTVVLIGHAGHEEIEGTLGEAPDRTVLVQTVADVAELSVADPERVSYLTQTTLAVDETTEIIQALRARFPALRGPGSDDICYATTNLQNALTAIAAEADLVLAVSSPNSSNSLRLVDAVIAALAELGPVDLKGLPIATLPALAREIRAFLIDRVSGVGGHLGPNLGMVELTIAAHRVFDSPRYVLLFDTGHQAYVHKIHTRRCAEFDSLQAGGMSGYPSRAESVHDVIENSHASTALSYADGLAKAFAPRGTADRRVVAIVGDGALTGGMCWEALNNIGAASHRPVIIVLNDNARSYAPTIGGLARHLAELRQGHRGPSERGPAENNRQTVFEDFGLAYLGPVDGHDIASVEGALRQAASLRRPVMVHCVTRKGKSYPPAERDETDCLHTVGVIDPTTGRPRSAGKPTWTSVFGEEITAIGADRDDVVCVSAAMPHPTGLGGFATRFPDRTFDVGIAEQHAVTSAAGQDGPSHHGIWDACILPVIPGLRLAAPRDCARLRELLREASTSLTGPP